MLKAFVAFHNLHRLTLGMLCECHMTLKLVTRILPLSPALPLVSSIESNLSMSISPGRIFIWLKGLGVWINAGNAAD